MMLFLGHRISLFDLMYDVKTERVDQGHPGAAASCSKRKILLDTQENDTMKCSQTKPLIFIYLLTSSHDTNVYRREESSSGNLFLFSQ